MAKMTKCKVCGADMASNAKACPQCGAKNKKPIFKRWWFWAVCVVVVIVIAAASGSGNGAESKKYANLSESEYKAQCMAVKYDDVARNPDNYKGTLVKFHGEVIQVVDGSTVTLRINQDNDDEMFSSDTWYATYRMPDGGSRILDGDSITVFGECTGTKTYRSALGGNITIPSVIVRYYQ